jgi:hypothetical protein
MEKKVLSEIDIYSGEIKIPLDFKIDRKEIFSSILYNCFIEKNNFNYNNTFKVDGSQPLSWFHDYIIEFSYLKHNLQLETVNHYGLILYPGEINDIKNENNLNINSDYTVIYGINSPKNSTKFILNYNDKNKFKTYNEDIYDNKFIIFPSTQNYFLTKNNNKDLTCFLICNYKKR